MITSARTTHTGTGMMQLIYQKQYMQIQKHKHMNSSRKSNLETVSGSIACNTTPKESEMSVEIVGIWIRKFQMDGRLPRDFLTWKSLCGSTIAELLRKTENNTAHPDPCVAHKNEDGKGS